MLPKGVKLLWGFAGLYVGLFVFLLTNALIYFRYDGVPASTPVDPVLYVGLVIMVVVPAWFWVGRPLFVHLTEQSGEDAPDGREAA